MEQTRVETSRLTLVPLDPPTRAAVLGGDTSSIDHVSGWPHADTRDALRAGWPVWLIVVDDRVVGDCGTAGDEPDDGGVIEIGIGLAEEARGQQLGREAIRALSDWLLARPGIERVVAQIEPENTASQRAFRAAGFARLNERLYAYPSEPPARFSL